MCRLMAVSEFLAGRPGEKRSEPRQLGADEILKRVHGRAPAQSQEHWWLIDLIKV